MSKTDRGVQLESGRWLCGGGSEQLFHITDNQTPRLEEKRGGEGG